MWLGAVALRARRAGIAGSFIASRAPMSTLFIAFCRAPSAAPVAASATREARSGSQHCGGGVLAGRWLVTAQGNRGVANETPGVPGAGMFSGGDRFVGNQQQMRSNQEVWNNGGYEGNFAGGSQQRGGSGHNGHMHGGNSAMNALQRSDS